MPKTPAMVFWMASAAALRVGCVAYRPTDYDVIGPVTQCVFDGDDPFLIICGAILDRAYARSDDQQLVIDRGAQGRDFEAGSNHTVTAGFERSPRARQNQFAHITPKAEVIEVAAIEAGQGGNSQNFDIALGATGRFHDALVTVHGCVGDAPVSQVADRGGNGSRHIEKLQIDKNFLVACNHPVEQLKVAAGHAEFEPEFVKGHRIAQLFNQFAGGGSIRHIECEN